MFKSGRMLIDHKNNALETKKEFNMKPGMFQDYKACITPTLAIISFYAIFLMIGGWKLIISILIVSIVLLVWFAISSR